MKVLHLFSNAKYTGPAEPALNLCVALRRLGVEADLAFPALPPDKQHTLLETARDRGIEPILQFRLSKHRNPFANFFDTAALNRYLARNSYDVVHCHLENDHRIAISPARKHGIPLVRSNYDGTGLQRPSRQGPLLGGTARLIEPSQMALDHDAETYRFPRESMQVVPGAVDVERFDPAREVPDGRRWLGIPPHAFVVGIVARMQMHRRYEDFFEAIRRMVDAGRDAHAIVVGRGTNQERVGWQPVQKLGLTGRVHFPGYIGGENYVGMVKAFSAKVFLVPGSDGTCRAVREAMAMGRPAVVANRGMLPEIVDDGVTGMVFDGSADGLFNALMHLSGDRSRAVEMGRAARRKAVGTFSLEVQAGMVSRIYEDVLGDRR
jgi:glycosyltransferase involved in cell wall biosynthesis